MKLRSIFVLFCFFCLSSALYAQFDMASYQQIDTIASSSAEDFFYPEYFRNKDKVSYKNIVAEIRFRYEFLAGLAPEPACQNCYKMQKRIEKALEKLRKDQGILSFKRIDNELLFNEKSPVSNLLKPNPRRVSEKCSYHSVGDISKDGLIYCSFHGPAEGSPLYLRYQKEIVAARPWISSFDIVEIMIFLPALIILPVTWLVMKKVLEKKQS